MLVETHGLPLEIILDRFRDEGLVPDWPRFFQDARDKNWSLRTTRAKVEEAIGDVFGPDYRREWQKELERFLETWRKEP